jgi:pimeloyl-ACP methyl ester carboxylesterase
MYTCPLLPSLKLILLYFVLHVGLPLYLNAQLPTHPDKDLKGLSEMRALQYPFSIHYATLDTDLEIAYVDEGSGKQTLLFIHGLGSYIPAWSKNIEVLKAHFRCIAIDLPGYGHSSKAPHSGKMSYYAEVIVKLMDHLQLDKVVLVGHSMGGQIAIMTAYDYPNKVDKLILTAPAGFETFSEGQKQWFREVMTLKGVKLTPVNDIQSNLAYNFYNMPKDADFMIQDRIAMRSASDFDAYCYAIVQSVRGMVDEPVFDILPNIQQKTLVIYGANDNLIPNRYLNPGTTSKIAQQGTDQMVNATLQLIPKAGHFVMYEKAEEFNRSVLTFLSN